ncbi:MAG TPA: extracellular solute-binding protein [Candidatus Angelobacter sp.]|nr:extracellular solute-binding protein [Candidatus Angelobacter sp.]
MNLRLAALSIFFSSLFCGIADSALLAAASDPAAIRVKKEAEGKGYIFAATHEEIVSQAKKEGKLRVICSLSAEVLRNLRDGFTKKYPFIEARAEEVRGTEVYLRMLEEMKAGVTQETDITDLAVDYLKEYLPYQKKFDILGMVEQKVLEIPHQAVDPINRNIVSIAGSGIQVVTYNKKLIAANKIPVPDTWEAFLRPEFKDRKFVSFLRVRALIALVPAWGLRRVLDFAQKLAAQKPVWVNNQSRALTELLAGEHALQFGANFDTFLRVKKKDLTDSLGYKLVEPVPVRIDEPWGVLSTAVHPYAALLWLEFVASPEGQKILDEDGPYLGSFFVRGTVQEQAIRGKQLSLIDWHHFLRFQEYQEKITEALGFPRADK